MRKEAMPVESLGRLVPGPVGLFRVGEDDGGVLVKLVRFGPDIHLALRRARRRHAGSLEPGVLIAGVVDDQLDHDLYIALVSALQKRLEIVQGSIRRVDVDVVGDVIAVVAQRRGKKRQQPNAGDPEILQVVEPRDQAGEVPDPVPV